MFMRYARRRTQWRHRDVVSAAVMTVGLTFGTLVATLGLTSAAGASPLDAEILARMMAAPQIVADGSTRVPLFLLMSVALAAMAAGCAKLSGALLRDLEQGTRRRR